MLVLRCGRLPVVLLSFLCMRLARLGDLGGGSIAEDSGNNRCVLGDLRCERAQGEAAGVFEILLKPQAYIVLLKNHPAMPQLTKKETMAMVERLGHVVSFKPLDMVGTEDGQPGKFFQDLCSTDWWGLVRCCKHSWDSIRDAYTMDDNTYEHLEGAYQARGQANIYDKMFVVDEADPIAVQFTTLFPDGSWQNGLAERALRFRYGHHIYPKCNTLNDIPHFSASIHKNRFNLPWLLAPLWEKQWEEAVPKRVSFVNLGCRGFEETDPMFSLQQTGAEFEGLCLDADGGELAKARERLRRHPAMHVVKAFLTPGSISDLLREFVPQGAVEILKVDIDSFDAGVLDAALDVLHASVVIAEFQFVFPPPFRFARHYASEGQLRSAGFFGASLSYLVELLARRGFFLYKMNELDAVWIHISVADRFVEAEREEGLLAFPVDEWACYLQTPYYLGDSRVVLPVEYTREWLLDSDVHNALLHVWGNLTKLGPDVPFVLDLAQPGPATVDERRRAH